MRFFAFNDGFVKPFKIKNADGTPKDLIGLTVQWYFVDRDGNSPAGSPVPGVITDAAAGQVRFTIPEGMFTKKTRYICQLNLSSEGYDEDTKAFTVDIDNPRLRDNVEN